MSLGEAFRRLGHIEAARKYAEDAPWVVGQYASGAFEEVGEALEHFISSRLYGALEAMEERQDEFREELITAIKEGVKRGVQEALAEGLQKVVTELTEEVRKVTKEEKKKRRK